MRADGLEDIEVQPEFRPAGHVLNIAGRESPRREEVLARFEDSQPSRPRSKSGWRIWIWRRGFTIN